MGYVYLIEDSNNNCYKIGVTKGDPEKRLKKLQTGNPSKLEIKYLYKYDYPYRLESMLHRHYRSCNELNEWFSLENPNEFLNKCVELSNMIDALKDNPFFNKGLNKRMRLILILFFFTLFIYTICFNSLIICQHPTTVFNISVIDYPFIKMFFIQIFGKWS